MARPEFAENEPLDLQPDLTVLTNAINIAAELTVRHQIEIVVAADGSKLKVRAFTTEQRWSSCPRSPH